MRQGINELVQYEKKAKEKRVYTYEKAAERYHSCPGLSLMFLGFCADIFHICLGCWEQTRVCQKRPCTSS